MISVHCSECGALLPDGRVRQADSFQCPVCGSSLQVFLFPAAFKTSGPAVAQPLLSDGESSCFYHPNKRAAVPCDQCGRFLCQLCRVDFGQRVLCPQCIHSGARKGSLTLVESQRKLYDTIALALAAIPAFIIWPTLITAPIAIYLSIKYWRRPLSVVPRSRWRFVLAILIALAQIAAWAALAIFFFSGFRRSVRI